MSQIGNLNTGIPNTSNSTPESSNYWGGGTLCNYH